MLAAGERAPFSRAVLMLGQRHACMAAQLDGSRMADVPCAHHQQVACAAGSFSCAPVLRGLRAVSRNVMRVARTSGTASGSEGAADGDAARKALTRLRVALARCWVLLLRGRSDECTYCSEQREAAASKRDAGSSGARRRCDCMPLGSCWMCLKLLNERLAMAGRACARGSRLCLQRAS